jgi:DNA-binding PadR family transcriptional regulator
VFDYSANPWWAGGVSAVRLFVLGALARGGPMHGHQIRRGAVVDHVESWADVKPGSLYAALHRLADENLIEVVRTERDGNQPARTIYGITARGRHELAVIRDRLLGDARLRPDPVDLALALHNTADLSADALRTLIEKRRDAFAGQRAALTDHYADAQPHLTGLEPLTFRHTLQRLDTEIDWHDQLLAALRAPLDSQDFEGGST